MKKFLIPLALFLVLAGFLFVGLGLNPREVPSPLIGKPVPAFSAPLLANPAQHLAPAELRGKVWMLNVWASWCGPCREEHPVVTAFAQRKLIPVYGLNYKDQAANSTAWLREQGDPYTASLVDADGRIGLDFGVYGVPETFVIDQAGVIRYKKVGVLTPEVVDKDILPLLRSLGVQA